MSVPYLLHILYHEKVTTTSTEKNLWQVCTITLQKPSLCFFNKKVYFTECSHLIIIDVRLQGFPDEGSDV